MKQVKCPDCDVSVDTMYAGETIEEVMGKMMPHYKEVHADVMQSATPEKHQAWMADFNKSFDEAPELPVKTIGCYEEGCEEKMEHADRDEVLNQMLSHYNSVHPEVIPNASDEDKKAWMVQFEKDWTAVE